MIKISDNDDKLALIASMAEEFFGRESPLADACRFGGRPYEFRPQQGQMALVVSDALVGSRNLCIEAPTGVGKSFAYLVPAIHYALAGHKPVLISTETINLQEQLILKDIPILQQLMNLDFKAALAKGRGNYLCRRRLGLVSGEGGSDILPLDTSMSELERLKSWAERTSGGTLSDIDFNLSERLWNSVCCEAGNCSGPKCDFFRRCFYWRARREWERADIIVANHSLFFVDLKIKSTEDLENTLLPPYSAVVIDEAHTIEDNAASCLGLHLSRSWLRYFLSRLYNPSSGRGLLVKAGQEALEIRKFIDELQSMVTAFFDMLQDVLDEREDSIFRVRRPGIVPDLLSESLGRLASMLKSYLRQQEDENFRSELESQMEKCDAASKEIHDFLNMLMDEHVYWIESRRGKSVSGNVNISLMTAPLNVNEMLGKMLFSKGIPVILTSATLTVSRNMDYYRSRTGFSGGEELVLDSPFDHRRQVRLFIPRDMPEPDHRDYFDAAVARIKHFIGMTGGKAFVLFTSYSMLRRCAEAMRPFFEDSGIRLLVQGDDLNRSAMLKEFRGDRNSVIFGTSSFWTGVDVPGDALSNVIVTKLPFSVPSHPLIQARCERIQDAGASPFMEYSLPEAVLKLRQGVGRLIRSRTDRGIVVILDRRVISKRYGRCFLDSLPEYNVEYC